MKNQNSGIRMIKKMFDIFINEFRKEASGLKRCGILKFLISKIADVSYKSLIYVIRLY